MKKDEILSLLGLCAKAGRIKHGEYQVEQAAKGNQTFLVIIATDVSEGSEKKYRDMCAYYKVPIYEYGTKEELGRAIGKEFRASVAITDEGFAKGIIKKLESREEHR